MQQQKLVQKQFHKMSFVPKMQESMHILQLGIMDLKNMVETEMELNPILEEEPYEDTTGLVNLQPAEKNSYNIESFLTRPISLQEYLSRQLRMLDISASDMEIGEEIIGNIDDDGYLKASSEEIARALNKTVSEIETVINMVQGLEPVGAGARNLKECLLLQLKAKGKKDSLSWKIVENYLEECGKKHFSYIARSLGVSVDEVKSAVGEITKLEPKPGRRYETHDENAHIVPDIYIKKMEDEYHVLTNQYDLRPVRINSAYKNLLKDANCDQETKNYIDEKLKSANFLIKCMNQRRETLQKIVTFLVREQPEFIEKGRLYLRPLTFKDMAKAIGRHESTISRAIANKYIETPSGIYELREFFSGKIKNGNNHIDSNNHHSATSVKMELRAVVDKEDKRKPLSDQKLQNILAEKGINISRRTIAKYRESLKILPSHLRKT